MDDYAFDITRLLNGSHNVFGDMDSIQPSDIPEIAKYFEELVPFQMSKEEFWSRYYFRVHKLNSDSTYMKMGNKSEEEEDDENIPWDIEEDTNPSSRAVGDDEEAFSEKHTVRQNEAAEDISNGEEMNNSMLGMTMLNINAYDYNSLVHENSKLKASNSELKDRVRSLESELITTKVEYELMIKALQDKLESSLKTDPSPSNVSSSVSHTSTSNSSAMPTESDSAITQSTSCGESVASPEPISTVAPTAVYDGTVKYIADEDVETTQSIASTNQSTSSLVYVPSDIPLVSGSVVEKTCLSDEEDEESWD